MSVDDFASSTMGPAPPAGLGLPLQALWWERRGDWHRAHAAAQADEDDPAAAWVHAHLHRAEGDAGNARFWYARAGRPPATGPLDVEWRAIAAALLAPPSPRTGTP